MPAPSSSAFRRNIIYNALRLDQDTDEFKNAAGQARHDPTSSGSTWKLKCRAEAFACSSGSHTLSHFGENKSIAHRNISS
jgi:hypothetical protein